MGNLYRPSFVKINLSAIEYNLRKLKKILRRKKLMFVVKANAYGHGMREISSFAQKKNLCDYFGVSSIEEGVVLREKGIKKPILVLGSVFPLSNFPAFFRYNLIPTVSSLWSAKELVKTAKKLDKRISCHIKMETGMNRIGVSSSAFSLIMDFFSAHKEVKVEGVYSHLSSADSDRNYTLKQISDFSNATCHLKGKIIRHIANSAGLINYKTAAFDMARCGYAAYGYMQGFKPAMSVHSKIVFIKYVKKDSFISYNKTFRTFRKTKIATIPIGYGDGYLRAFSNKAYVLVGGKKCKIVGNVTMDMIMADITDVKNAKVGDEVIVLGEGITLNMLSSWAKTIGYEITTLITSRMPRFYGF